MPIDSRKTRGFLANVREVLRVVGHVSDTGIKIAEEADIMVQKIDSGLMNRETDKHTRYSRRAKSISRLIDEEVEDDFKTIDMVLEERRPPVKKKASGGKGTADGKRKSTPKRKAEGATKSNIK